METKKKERCIDLKYIEFSQLQKQGRQNRKKKIMELQACSLDMYTLVLN